MAMIVIFFFFVFITNDLHHASYFRGNVITNAIEMHLFQQLPPQQLPPQQLPPFSEYLKAPKFSGPNLMESKVDQFSLSKQKLYTPDENYKMLKRLQHLHQNYFDQDRNDLELDRNDLELDWNKFDQGWNKFDQVQNYLDQDQNELELDRNELRRKQLEYDHTHNIEHILHSARNRSAIEVQSKLRQSNFEEYLVLEDHLKTIKNRINNNFSVDNKLKLTEFNLNKKQTNLSFLERYLLKVENDHLNISQKKSDRNYEQWYFNKIKRK
jgi:hypothetical protein